MKDKIRVYDTRSFTGTFMPARELHSMFRGDLNSFFILPVQKMIRHVHKPVPASKTDNHTFIFLTAGTAFMKIGDRKHSITRDQLLVVPAGQVFSFEAYDETKFNKGFIFNFNPRLLSEAIGPGRLLKEPEFLKIWGDHRLTLDRQTARYVRQLLERLYTEYAGNGFNNIALIKTYLLTLLCELDCATRPVTPTKPNAGTTLSHRFRELLAKNIKKVHRVSEYATLLHVTPNHLNKMVRTATGRSPTKWIDEHLILEAKVLLCQTSLSVGEVSTAVGIEDPSYFSRLFKKYEGITPLDYRKMC